MVRSPQPFPEEVEKLIRSGLVDAGDAGAGDVRVKLDKGGRHRGGGLYLADGEVDETYRAFVQPGSATPAGQPGRPFSAAPD
jgi:hypothetical protein